MSETVVRYGWPFFYMRHNYKNDCYIFGNFCAYTVKTASSEAYP